MKYWGSQTNALEVSLTNRFKDMEERISSLEDKVEEINRSVKEIAKSKKKTLGTKHSGNLDDYEKLNLQRRGIEKEKKLRTKAQKIIF